MKKILAIFLAAFMLLSLVACGDNNTTDPDKDNPGVSQSGENNDNQGGENVNAKTYDWPTEDWITASMNYTGTGDIVIVRHQFDDENTEIVESEKITVRFNNSSIDDVLAYAKALENDGFVNPYGDKEPKANGNYLAQFSNPDTGRNVNISYYAEPVSNTMMDTSGSSVKHTYNLDIVLIKGNKDG